MLLAVGFSTAAANASTRSALALMPLPSQTLGTAAGRLPLNPWSGVQTNADAAGDATGAVTPQPVTRRGRITGYWLDYSDRTGRRLVAGRGLVDVSSQVSPYTSGAAARKALELWHSDELALARRRAGIAFTVSSFAPPASLGAGYGVVATERVPGKRPFTAAGVEFASGALIAQISATWAGTSVSRSYVEKLATKLAARIRDVKAGRISGPPRTLPARPTAGPPPNAPPLGGLTLTAGGIGGGKRVLSWAATGASAIADTGASRHSSSVRLRSPGHPAGSTTSCSFSRPLSARRSSRGGSTSCPKRRRDFGSRAKPAHRTQR
jgi:hypothetical protein